MSNFYVSDPLYKPSRIDEIYCMAFYDDYSFELYNIYNMYS